MALPFLSSRTKQRDQILAIDLGSRTTKAVHLQRKGDGFALMHYAVLDAPIYEKSVSVDLLTEHLKAVVQALDSKTKVVTVAVGVADSIMRHTEMPQMPVGDLRNILKNNTKVYLQQDLPGYVFDCYVMPIRLAAAKNGDKAKLQGVNAKQKVLVAGAKKQFLNDLQSALKNAGLIADSIVPGLIGVVNAFEHLMPATFLKEVVALVDIGFRHTTICVLQEGELILSRVVGIGGDKITNGLAEALNVGYAEAEGIKLGMPQEVQPNLETLVTPLGRELRASIDFFEHQQDRPVSQVFVSGGSARSEHITKILEAELMLPCKGWNPTSFLQPALPPQQLVEIEQIAPQLAVAIGAAVVAL